MEFFQHNPVVMVPNASGAKQIRMDSGGWNFEVHFDYLPAIDYEVQDTPDEALRWRDRGEEDAAKKRNLRVILEDCPCPKNTFAEMQWA